MKIKQFEDLPSRPGRKGNAHLETPLRVLHLKKWTLDTIITFNIGGDENGLVQTLDRSWHDPEEFIPAPTVEQAQALAHQMISEALVRHR